MRTIAVPRVSNPVPLVGNTSGTAWERSEPIEIDQFLWTTPEDRPQTTVRALYDEGALYLHYTVTDRHSYATTTTLNGPVWEDSCVEFFATPRPRVREAYLNFEVNCVGTYHLGYGPDRGNRALVERETAATIEVQTSIDGPKSARRMLMASGGSQRSYRLVYCLISLVSRSPRHPKRDGAAASIDSGATLSHSMPRGTGSTQWNRTSIVHLSSASSHFCDQRYKQGLGQIWDMEEISTSDAPDAIGPYSQGIIDDGRVYVSGQGPIDPDTGGVVSEDVSEQTAQTLENISAILDSAGSSLSDVVHANVYVTDIEDYETVNEMYAEYLTEPYPARAAMEVSRLPIEIAVEIEVVASV